MSIDVGGNYTMKIFKCDECGAVFEMVLPATKEVEGGHKLREMKPGTTDAATEKHVPVVNVVDGHLEVKVGDVEHPMTPEHWITAIWVEFEDGAMRKVVLTPDQKPEAHFCLHGRTGKVTVYEFCNLHGLWKTEIEL